MMDLSRSAFRYQAKKESDNPVKTVLKDLADRQPTWGVDKLTDLIGHFVYKQSEPKYGLSTACFDGWRHQGLSHIIECSAGAFCS